MLRQSASQRLPMCALRVLLEVFEVLMRSTNPLPVKTETSKTVEPGSRGTASCPKAKTQHPHRSPHVAHVPPSSSIYECIHDLLSRIRDLHLGLAVNLEIMQRLFRHNRRGLVCILDKGDILLGGDGTDLDQAGIAVSSVLTGSTYSSLTVYLPAPIPCICLEADKTEDRSPGLADTHSEDAPSSRTRTVR